jgi:hypothetical protein
MVLGVSLTKGTLPFFRKVASVRIHTPNSTAFSLVFNRRGGAGGAGVGAFGAVSAFSFGFAFMRLDFGWLFGCWTSVGATF